MSTANNSSLIVDQLITYADWFFPGDIDFDRDLDVSFLNGTEIQGTGMRRAVSNSSLSDHGGSPPPGSPKPATRRKNKPAPTPPSGTPDKHDKKFEEKEKVQATPDKPPRPVATPTVNKSGYKPHKNDNANAENIDKSERIDKSLEAEAKPLGFEVINKSDIAKAEFQDRQNEPKSPPNDLTKSDSKTEHNKTDNKHSVLIGFEALHNKDFSETDVENSSSKPKPVPAEKPSPSTLERRRVPVAAPRSLTTTTQPSTGWWFDDDR